MGEAEKKEDKIEQQNVEKKTEFKTKMGTVGNFLLAMLIILILVTGSLTYYLIHSEKENYDKQQNELAVDTMAEETEEEPETIANIIDSALADVTTSTTVDGTTTDADSRKIMNEKLIVLYNGLILDVSKMDEVSLQYIDAHSDEKDKYIITYTNYENNEKNICMSRYRY